MDGKSDNLTAREMEIWNLWQKLYHDFASDLSVISLAAKGLTKYYPQLVAACNEAHERGFEIELPSKAQLNLLQNSLETIDQSVVAHLWRLKFYRMQLNPLKSESLSLKNCQIKHCLEKAFCQFPGDDLPKFDLSAIEDFSFHGDHEVVKHVVFNLLDNAIYQVKAIGKKGGLNIFTTDDDISNYLHFKDYAGGIPPEVLPKIFDKYFTTKECKPGLGLYFCQKAMRCFQGNIRCVTDAKEGSTDFILQFPKIL
jgi:two-component system, CAI-1 autoinducer sensor kinase/phosphatase CqsS